MLHNVSKSGSIFYHHMNTLRTCICFFGSPDLSAALIHIQWLVSYVVLNLYAHMHSDPLVIYIQIYFLLRW